MIRKKIIASVLILFSASVVFSCKKKNQISPDVAKAIEIHRQIIITQEKMNTLDLDDDEELEELETKITMYQDKYDSLREKFNEVEQKQFEEELSKLGK